MGPIRRLLGRLLAIVIAVGVMVVLATVVFYITVFIVSTGASLAGLEPDDEFVVLSASLIVVAIILTGGFTPRLSDNDADEPQGQATDDPAYN